MITQEYKNIFEVPVRSVDGEDNYLQQFQGKILFFVNTTGKCGNSMQWPVIERILSDYKEQGVEVIYTPTNDYCGSVTFGDYQYGIAKGKLSADYAFNTYGVQGNFTDLVSSRNKVWKEKAVAYDFEGQRFTPDVVLPDIDLTQAPRDPLYNFLIGDPDKELLCGNFHKFITNRAGQPVAVFHNGTLIDAAIKSGYAEVGAPDEEEENLRAVLDEIVATDTCTDPRYAYNPYKDIMPH